jgi:hypothetical protein
VTTVSSRRDAAYAVRPGADGALAAPVSRPSRLLLGVLLGIASLVHLALTPEHYREQPLFGAFFGVAGVVQLFLAVRLLARPAASWRLLQLLRVTSLLLLSTYVATRLVTPPLAPHAGAEPVDVLGVLTGGVELASVVAVLALPARAGRTATTSKLLWGSVVAIAYIAFFAVASGAVVYNRDGWPPDVAVPSVTLRDAGYWSLLTPRVNLVPTEHLAVSVPVLTAVTLALSAVLLGANTALARTAAERLPGRRRPALAAVPAFLAAPVCCGAPLLAFFGTSALALFAVYTPVLLAVVALALAVHGSAMLRALRLANPTSGVLDGARPLPDTVPSAAAHTQERP